MPPLRSLAPEWVLYAASVSKIFVPGMRLGILAGPARLIERAAAIKSAFNMQPSGILQAVAAKFLDPRASYLREHLDGLLPVYRTRRNVMLEALEQAGADRLAQFRLTRPRGGMFIWLSSLEGADFDALYEPALRAGVAYVPGSAFYSGTNRPTSALRLNYASTPEAMIAEGIKRLAGAV